MHGFTPFRELLSGLSSYTSARKGSDQEVPLFRRRRQRQSSKPFNIDMSVSTEIERHPGTNLAFPTAKTHHRQHATTSPRQDTFSFKSAYSPRDILHDKQQDDSVTHISGATLYFLFSFS
ncbi:hypothetical protein CDL15_Pgr026298 [Punica granatum]|nr:hypothetical protein CDL15_Pgr026298 [Punica granatum]